MLLSGLSVVAALAFVLGLAALSLWLVKRFGPGTLSSRNRLPVEVVQRIALTPKMGLAVVRVGDRVMAVSTGEGGVRALFDLDESDRQRVLSSSTVATPFATSAISGNSAAVAADGGNVVAPGILAAGALAVFRPGAFGRLLTQTLEKHVEPLAIEPAAELPAVTPLEVTRSYEVRSPEVDFIEELRNMTDEVLALRSGAPLTYARGAVAAAAPERDFRVLVGSALSHATKLAVFVGAMIVSQVMTTSAGAQAAPPVSPPVTSPVAPPVTAPVVTSPTTPATTPAVTPAPTPAITPAPTAVATQAAPVAPLAPELVLPPSARRTVRPSRAATPAQVGAPNTAPTARRTGNGTTVTPGGASSTRPVSAMTFDSTTSPPGTPAGAATPAPIAADDAIMRMMPQMDVKVGNDADGGLRLSGTVGIVVMMGLLTLLPTLLLMMTGFTRILIVLHFLKQAMGTQSAPPAQLLAALALLLTGFVMSPTLTEMNKSAITPWLDGQITQVEMLKTGVKPMREFMLRQTKESDIRTFVEMSHLPRPQTADDIPLHVLMSAFVASELRTAFQIGFVIYLPFIIIDAVVASVLMSMGMMMLPPAMISLPFKLLLFVLVDGWSLTIQSLVQSFK